MNKRQFYNEDASFSLLKSELIREIASVMIICYSTKGKKGLVYDYIKDLIYSKIRLWVRHEGLYTDPEIFAETYLIVEFGKSYFENAFNTIIREFFDKYDEYRELKDYFLKLIEYKGEKYI